MTEQSYESKVKNLPCDTTGYATKAERLACLDGHKVARHAAAKHAAQADARIAELEAALAKEERRAIAFGDCLNHQILAMRAAVVAGHLESPEHGMQWIVNSLAGPGHLPDLDEARELGGAQALFDKEMAEHDAFRAAHPGPAEPARAALGPKA